jgi:hypothetical protein
MANIVETRGQADGHDEAHFLRNYVASARSACMKTERDEKAVPYVFFAIFHTAVALMSSTAAKLIVLQVTRLHGTRNSHSFVFREAIATPKKKWFKQKL